MRDRLCSFLKNISNDARERMKERKMVYMRLGVQKARCFSITVSKCRTYSSGSL